MTVIGDTSDRVSFLGLQGVTIDKEDLERTKVEKPQDIQVFINSFQDPYVFTLQISTRDTILDLKLIISEKTMVLCTDQLLCLQNTDLEHHHTLVSYGIQEGSSITLLLRLRDGGDKGNKKKDKICGSVSQPDPGNVAVDTDLQALYIIHQREHKEKDEEEAAKAGVVPGMGLIEAR